MLKKLFVCSLVSLLLIGVFASAQSPIKLKGYLIDMMCANAYADEPNALAEAKKHPKECSLMPQCKKDGYAVMTEDGTIYKLDKVGNKKAAEILDKTTTEEGLVVAFEADIKGKVLYVKTMAEAETAQQEVKE